VYARDDIARSIRRYLSMTMPVRPEDDPRWKIRVERREVSEEERPVGVVVLGDLSTTRARTSLIQGEVEQMLPVTINLYPAPSSASADDLRSGRREADDLATRLDLLFNTGLTVKVGARHFAGPFRIPLWDYAEIPLTGKEKTGPGDPHDVLWVEEKSLLVKAVQDPEDARLWSVIANMRVTFERPGRVPAADEYMDIDSLSGTFVGEPPIPAP